MIIKFEVTSLSKNPVWLEFAFELFSVLCRVKKVAKLLGIRDLTQLKAVHFPLDVRDDSHIVRMGLFVSEHRPYFKKNLLVMF